MQILQYSSLFCLFFPVVSFAIPDAVVAKKKAAKNCDVSVNRVFLNLSKRLKASSESLPLSASLSDNMTIEAGIHLLAANGLLNKEVCGRTLLKEVLQKKRRSLDIIKGLIRAGARPEVPVCEGPHFKKKQLTWTHLCEYALNAASLNQELIGICFSSDLRMKIFPQGFSQAEKLFHRFIEINTNNYRRGLTKTMATHLQAWADEKKIVFDPKGIELSKTAYSATGIVLKHRVLSAFLGRSNRRATLSTFVPELKSTVGELLQELHAADEITKPCYNRYGRPCKGLLHLAYQGRAQNDLIERLIEYGAPVISKTSASDESHALTSFIVILPKDELIKEIFSNSVQRKYFFNDDPQQARDLYNIWRKKNYQKAVVRKISYFKTCIDEWEQALSSSMLIEPEGALSVVADEDDEKSLISEVDTEQGPACWSTISAQEDEESSDDEDFEMAYQMAIAQDNFDVWNKAIEENNAWLDRYLNKMDLQ